LEFFSELERRGREPLLQDATGTVRFDLVRGDEVEHWLVSLNAGDATVSRANVGADCVVRTDKALFDGIARGEVSAMAALLRGELTVDGDLELLQLFQRLFPGPSRAGGAIEVG
jgi:putative sterol carrier protein